MEKKELTRNGKRSHPDRRKVMCGNRIGIERPGRVYLPEESEMGASSKIKINEPTEICSCQIFQKLSHQKDSASST